MTIQTGRLQNTCGVYLASDRAWTQGRFEWRSCDCNSIGKQLETTRRKEISPHLWHIGHSFRDQIPVLVLFLVLYAQLSVGVL